MYIHLYALAYVCAFDAAQTVVMSSLEILYSLSLSLLLKVLSLKVLLCSVCLICVEQQHFWGLGRLIIEVSREALPTKNTTNTKGRTSMSSAGFEPTIPRIRRPQT